MRKIFFILLLTVGMVFSTEAQPSAKNLEEVKKEIQRLTSEWNKAVKNQDSIALVEILSPNFTLYTYDIDSGTAAKIPLDKWLYNTLHHFTTDSGGVIGEQKVTVYGLAAKNEHTGFWEARFDNGPKFNLKFAVTDIWIKENGKWRALMRMSYIVK